jgi:hypothetical protein
MGAFFLKLALGGLNILKLIGGAIASFFRALNVQGWIGLGVALLLGFLLLQQHGETRHWHKQSDQFEKLYRGELANEARIAKQARDLKRSIDTLTANISQTMRDWNNAENRRIASSADTVRVLGPGKAICPGGPVIAAGAGGPQSARGPGDASVAQVPSGERVDLIALPFAPTVDFAEQHDLNRAEVLTWREWYRKLLAAWPGDQRSARTTNSSE